MVALPSYFDFTTIQKRIDDEKGLGILAPSPFVII